MIRCDKVIKCIIFKLEVKDSRFQMLTLIIFLFECLGPQYILGHYTKPKYYIPITIKKT